MSELPNQEIEGRLNAQREVLSYLIAHLVHREGGKGGSLMDALERRTQFQDNQEDPGAVPAGPAIAIEGAMMREFDLIIREARSRLAELQQDRKSD
ncbi:hypothetical protein [Chelativorans sp. YIM 93263]|uniref:hypothetical protein n=1 Tax=Chelativorans sp. YIM 93263 TaxID=2906648 RepID=UPI0023799CF8|nr:hypothetical protein [Chelativorans sp. YIM 93263]